MKGQPTSEALDGVLCPSVPGQFEFCVPCPFAILVLCPLSLRRVLCPLSLEEWFLKANILDARALCRTRFLPHSESLPPRKAIIWTRSCPPQELQCQNFQNFTRQAKVHQIQPHSQPRSLPLRTITFFFYVNTQKIKVKCPLVDLVLCPLPLSNRVLCPLSPIPPPSWASLLVPQIRRVGQLELLSPRCHILVFSSNQFLSVHLV